jgi:glycosyltransferase involved in cell wall biosynthesis
LVGYSRNYLNRVVVIHNGMAERRSCLDRAAARHRFNLPTNAFILGNIGRLGPEKNHALMIEIARRVSRAVFAVAGDGSERAELERMIDLYGLRERVRLLGSIPTEDVPDFLAAADAFIMTSHYEGLPLSVIEAMQAGVPILASDIPPVREIVAADGEAPTAILAPLDATQPWVAAIEALRTGEIDTAALVQRALARAQAFRMEPMVDAYERVLLPPAPAAPSLRG